MNNKRIVSIFSGLSLIVLIAISSAGAVSPANDTSNTSNTSDINISNIPSEIEVDSNASNASNTSNASTTVNVSPPEPPKQPEINVPAESVPDDRFIELPPREDVIVYFKEMPPSIKGFASKYQVTPIFVKPDIKMAAFETLAKGKNGQVSQRTLEKVSELSKDPFVDKAFRDEYRFISREARHLVINAETGYYSTERLIQGPEYYENLGLEYVPNVVRVGFWRTPPSLEEFASKYGGKLMERSEADKFFMSAGFETDNIPEFINKISTDPYVKHVALVSIDPYSDLGSVAANDSPETAETVDTPKAPGFDSVTSILLLISVIFMVRRR